MSQRLRATFHDGAFVPVQPYDLPEGTEVELVVVGPALMPPESHDPDERARILAEVVDSIRKNPFPLDGPRFTRDEMHERG